jgi:hypothetical protein
MLDDWSVEPLTPAGSIDLMEIMNDRHGHKANESET